MKPHFILILHGIGGHQPGFSTSLRVSLHDVFETSIGNMLSQPYPVHSILSYEAVWSPAVLPDQGALWDALFPKMSGTDRIQYWTALREFFVFYLGDAVAYIESPGVNKYRQIHGKVLNALNQCASNAAAQGATAASPALLIIVGHSLGSVIASDLVYDLTNLARAQRLGISWPAELRLANFFTFGSPLSVYSLRFGPPRAFDTPIQLGDPDGLWINMYDPQDIIGYPVKPLNPQHNAAVFADVVLNAGNAWKFWQWWKQATPLSHNLYWEDKTVAEIIGRKVATDWVRENFPGQASRQRYADYKKWALEL